MVNVNSMVVERALLHNHRHPTEKLSTHHVGPLLIVASLTSSALQSSMTTNILNHQHVCTIGLCVVNVVVCLLLFGGGGLWGGGEDLSS